MPAALLIGMLGIWMVIVPLIPMSLDGRFLNDWLVGVIVMNVALTMASSHDWGKRLAAAAGIWICMSSFIPRLVAGTSMVTNDIIVGILLVVAAAGAIQYALHHPEPQDPQTTL
jgi:drug/metabolite transporter superfamily protein YnfA